MQKLKQEAERAADYAVKLAQEDTERLLAGDGVQDVAASNLPLGMRAIDERESGRAG
jgi:hypothetical protein